jgi:hypothetical protein
MAELFRLLADHELNILSISYQRDTENLPLGVVEVGILLETRGADDAEAVLGTLTSAGFDLA